VQAFFAQRAVVEQHGPTVRPGNAVDDSDEGGLAGTVGTQESKYLTGVRLQANAAQGDMILVGFGNVLNAEHGDWFFQN
jgi:hypothetical protein